MKVYQIYYDDASKANCEAEYIHYLNDNCTPFFENEVIRTLVLAGKHKEANYFGVVSHKLRQKTANSVVFRRSQTREFSPQAFSDFVQRSQAQIVSYNKNPKHDVCQLANRFHPNFSHIMKQLLQGLPYQIRACNTPIYFNHFVAKPEIWEEYTSTLLFPVMGRMESDEVIKKQLWQNSQYPAQLPIHLQKKWNVNYFPYHSFICERLISIFIANRPSLRAISW